MSMKRNVDSINNHTNGNPKIKKGKANNDDDDPLSSILGEIKTTQQGKQNFNNQARSAFSIENVLNKIIEMGSGNLDKLEVEGRVGLLVGGMNGGITFKPGMINDDWELLRHYLSSKSLEQKQINETDYIYDNCRVTYSEDLKKCIKKESKTSKTTYDQSSPLVYDFRISLCIEESSPPPLELPPDWHSKREKVRFTFFDKDWKIDLTRTIVRDQNQQHLETVFEVEVELYPQSIKSSINNQTLNVMLNNFINEIKSLITRIQPAGFLSFPDVASEMVTSPKEVESLRDQVFTYLPEANQYKYDTFPGSMPINFGKKHVYTVQSNDFFISEKTDGIRYMMLINEKGSFFIDRKFDFYQIQNYQVLQETFKSGALLDGEMVRHLGTGKPVYLVFDILAIENTCITKLLLSERLGYIGNKFILPLREAVGQNQQLPFTILGKVFMSKHKINDLFARIRDGHNGERLFQDDTQKRYHFTDGIIFTPNTPYLPYTVHNLFKWKYIDKWTIDFKVQERQKGWYLSCVGNGNQEVDCREVNFSDQDLDRLKKEFLRARDTNTIIAECSFQPKYGTWKFHQVRPDKKKGNYISIVMDTMESIAENLTVEELKYRIPLKPENDCWDEEMQKLRSTMLSNIRPKK